MKPSRKNVPRPQKTEATKKPWHPEYVEDLEEMAQLLKAPLDLFVGILDRRFAPGWALCGRLESLTQISEDVWMRSQTTEHPVFLVPPLGSTMPIVKESNAWAESFWNKDRITKIKEYTGLAPSVIGCLIYRQLGVRCALKASHLQSVTGIETSEWLNSRKSQHPAFCGSIKEDISWV